MPRTAPVAATPIAFVQGIVIAYERDGKSPASALAQAQIPPGLLRQPMARVTAAQFETLSTHAMRELDDEALGWFSRKLPWGSHGMLCRASITSPTLGVALKRWCRHHRLLTDDLAFTLQDDGTTATLALDERRDFGALREFCLVTNLRYVLGFACWAVDSRIALVEASFPFPAPDHTDVYPPLFAGPVHFNATRALVRFDARYLAMPMQRDEPALRAMLQRAVPLTVWPYRRDRLLVQRTREWLRRAGSHPADAAAVATALHVSSRTLHRQLRQEGASLQQLKDEVRRERAIDLLQRTSRSIKQVAKDTGFRNDKSFARAFRAWTGCSPSDFRLRGKAAPAQDQLPDNPRP